MVILFHPSGFGEVFPLEKYGEVDPPEVPKKRRFRVFALDEACFSQLQRFGFGSCFVWSTEACASVPMCLCPSNLQQ